MFRKNYALNSRSEEVLEATDATVSFHIGSDFSQDGLSPRSTTRHSIQVQGLSLTSVFSRLTYQPTILICDIEGAETEFHWAALPDSVDRLIIELHPRISGP